MNSSVFKMAFYISAFALFACGGNSNAVRDSARESLGGKTEAAAPGTTTPNTIAASAPAGSVQHYICPKNCAGSGGAAAGTCPVCGSAYVHNQAYHAQSQNTPSTSGDQTIQKVTFPGNTTTTTPPGNTTPPPPEPAQNAAGIWHYTCPKGCAGGAGIAGTCAACGGALAHNSAYHQ